MWTPRGVVYTPPRGFTVGGVFTKSWGGLTPPRGGLRKTLLAMDSEIN